MAKLNQRITILLTHADKRRLVQTAREKGQGVGEFIRAAIFYQLESEPKTLAERGEIQNK
jgi:hypothetical protein